MNQEEHEELARKLSAIEAPPPPEGLLDKLRADIPDEFPVANRTRVRHVTGWSLGLAASIMMMIGAAYFAVSYQKSATFEVAAPESARSNAVAKKSTAVVQASGTLQPTPAEAQSIAEQPILRAEADHGEAKTLSKQALPEKRDDLALPPPPPAAKPQVAYAPEAPSADVAQPRAMSGIEEGVKGGVAGGVVEGVAATRESESAESARNQAIAPQRNNAKDAPAPATAAAPAPMQMRMKSEAPAPMRVGDAIPPPRVLRKVDPIISAEARRAHIRGVVVVDAVIDPHGYVTRTTLLKGLPYGIDDAVTDAVRRWKFEPTVIDGRAVTVIYAIDVRIGE